MDIKKKLEEAVPELKKTGAVFLGFLSGKLMNAGIKKIIEKNPSADWLKYVEPFVEIGGGLVISIAAPEKGYGRYYGYGLTGAGLVNSIELIPFAADMLGGLGDNVKLPTVYYTEPGGDQPALEDFGTSAIPVKSFSLQAIPPADIDLPELGNGNSSEENIYKEEVGYVNTDENEEEEDDLTGMV